MKEQGVIEVRNNNNKKTSFFFFNVRDKNQLHFTIYLMFLVKGEEIRSMTSGRIFAEIC